MSIGLGGGKQKSSSSSGPITAEQQQGYYNQAMSNLRQYMPGADSYQAPQQQTLTGGDYEALTNAYTAPLDRTKSVDMAASDQAMADRGIYTSLNALRANNDVTERYAPAYAQAGGFAINAKQNELAQGNQMAMQNAAAADAAKWRTADYAANVWNGGKAQTSNSKSSGWSANASGGAQAS